MTHPAEDTLREPLAEIEALEAALGDPWDADGKASYANLMAYDEAAAYPQQSYEALVDLEMNARLVPKEFGGLLDGCHDSLLLYRTLARRCVTLATVALLPNIGYFAVLNSGTEVQKRRFGQNLMNGEGMCWGLSEKAFGSDVLSNETMATKTEDGYLISGEKWPIGLADRARMMVIQARTGEGPSPAAHTLMVFDRAQADRRTYRILENETLHGVRGLPLGGVRYENAPVNDANVIGEEGRSLEIILRAHQILRIGVSSTTLGSTDTGIRVALAFARERELFGDPIVNLPVTRRQLADGFADLLLGDILLMGAARALHVAPRRLYLQASIVKYFLPTAMEAVMQSMSSLIGARYFLRSNFANGIFQKMLRDGAMPSFVDGNTLVNLRVIGSQMPLAFNRIKKAREEGLSDKETEALAGMFNPAAQLGPAQWTKLNLQNNGLDLNLVGLRDAIARMEGVYPDSAIKSAQSLETELDALQARYETANAEYGKDFMQSAVFYDLAEQYCLLSTAGAAVAYAAHGASAVPQVLKGFDWLSYLLGRILSRFDPIGAVHAPQSAEASDAMVDALQQLYEENRAFSIIPYRHAGEMRSLSELEALHA